jgi:ABC-2 type transport system ATP-binding protein
LAPDSGRALLDGGADPQEAGVRRRIGVAPQALALYDELTGEGNLRFFGAIQGMKGRQLSERVKWALDFAGLTPRRGDKVAGYSGGMKRRLNLVAALIHDPEALLFDEPTAGVDPQSRSALLENVSRLRAEGRAILYTTHYMEEAQRICDRVAVMDHGKLLALDTVDGLISAYGGDRRIVAVLNGEEVIRETKEPVADLTRMQQEGELTRFRVEEPTLETVFLNLTGRELRDD